MSVICDIITFGGNIFSLWSPTGGANHPWLHVVGHKRVFSHAVRYKSCARNSLAYQLVSAEGF